MVWVLIRNIIESETSYNYRNLIKSDNDFRSIVKKFYEISQTFVKYRALLLQFNLWKYVVNYNGMFIDTPSTAKNEERNSNFLINISEWSL